MSFWIVAILEQAIFWFDVLWLSHPLIRYRRIALSFDLIFCNQVILPFDFKGSRYLLFQVRRIALFFYTYVKYCAIFWCGGSLIRTSYFDPIHFFIRKRCFCDHSPFISISQNWKMPHFSEGCCQAVLAAHEASMALIRNRHQELLQDSSTGKWADCPTITRVCKQMQDIYRELGPKMFRRAFRMKYTTFNLLYSKIHSKLIHQVMNRDRTKVRSHVVNGLIPLPVRLGCALWFWAGGDPHDLMLVFGISYCEVFRSIDFVCEAINQTKTEGDCKVIWAEVWS